jgi:glucose-6-phosphate 1-dehydrogenase
VVIEKPFGRDLASALELNRGITRVLSEEQIYRIDHYLGKETVLNMLSFRFGNAIFETLFNSKHVDHVAITVAESFGMEGRRGAFYERAGTLRDVVQNHGLQLLSLAAMEPPAVLSSKGIRDEKVKVLQSLRILSPDRVAGDVVRGQYVKGEIGGEAMRAYRDEEGVDARSTTETCVALRMHIDNWRWAGVPFYLRAGKCLPKRVTEIAVQFKQPPLHFFTTVECVGDVCDISQAKPNVLVFRIQPDEGISLIFSAKRPGMLFQIHPVQMDFLYNRAFTVALPEAYERLLLDALRGDQTLFMRSDEVEMAWRFVDPILKAWTGKSPPPLYFYEAGTWGPQEAGRLMDEGRAWRSPNAV